MKEQKGITLVALVITIIVLLILAGVTIAALSGQNGILTNASTAQKNTAVSEVREALAMAINTIYTNKYAGASEDANMNATTIEKIVKENYANLKDNFTVGTPDGSTKKATVTATVNGISVEAELDASDSEIWTIDSVEAK